MEGLPLSHCLVWAAGSKGWTLKRERDVEKATALGLRNGKWIHQMWFLLTVLVLCCSEFCSNVTAVRVKDTLHMQFIISLILKVFALCVNWRRVKSHILHAHSAASPYTCQIFICWYFRFFNSFIDRYWCLKLGFFPLQVSFSFLLFFGRGVN